jgi:hypothetical protein
MPVSSSTFNVILIDGQFLAPQAVTITKHDKQDQQGKERRRSMNAILTRSSKKSQWQGAQEDPKQKQDRAIQSKGTGEGDRIPEEGGVNKRNKN